MKAQIISFHCVMKNKLGQTLSSSFNQDVINQSPEGDDKLEGLVNGLQDLKEGEKRQVLVPANRAYGLYDPKLVFEFPRSELTSGDRLSLGSEVFGRVAPDSRKKSFRVIHAKADSVVIDGNHPLAGQDLIFDIEVIATREAVEDDFRELDWVGASRLIH